MVCPETGTNAPILDMLTMIDSLFDFRIGINALTRLSVPNTFTSKICLICSCVKSSTFDIRLNNSCIINNAIN